MKVVLRSLIEVIAVAVLIIIAWYNYQSYVPFILSTSFSDWLPLIIICSLSIVYFIAYLINKYWNKKTSIKTASYLALDLTRLYLENDFLEQVRRFGLEMNYNGLAIKPEILNKCSLDSLARLIAFVFYKNSSRGFDFTNIFYSLADLILSAWPEEVVEKFIKFVKKESIFLGEQLSYAVDRQKINREVEEFNQGIARRLEAMEELHAQQSLEADNQLTKQFSYHDYLTDGGSVLINWLLKKLKTCTFGLLKPAVIN